MHLPKTAIMATGGMDSTVLIYEYVKHHAQNPIIITVDYGHAAFQKQEELIRFHMGVLDIPQENLEIIKIAFPACMKTNGLFDESYVPNEEQPLEDWGKLRYADFFIEGRNMIMVAYALAFCSANQIGELQAGYLYGEEEWEKRRSYKLMTGDNSPQFVDAMNMLTSMGLSYQVRLRAPFYENRFSKKDVKELGDFLNVNFDKTYSCYFYPGPCGVCDNCLLRKELLV